uniref:ZM domain-containing protein n=1 Tax=Syphacia muris TaxID=451379 RepID=A0A0N5AJ97_9BILA
MPSYSRIYHQSETVERQEQHYTVVNSSGPADFVKSSLHSPLQISNSSYSPFPGYYYPSSHISLSNYQVSPRQEDAIRRHGPTRPIPVKHEQTFKSQQHHSNSTSPTAKSVSLFDTYNPNSQEHHQHPYHDHYQYKQQRQNSESFYRDDWSPQNNSRHENRANFDSDAKSPLSQAKSASTTLSDAPTGNTQKFDSPELSPTAKLYDDYKTLRQTPDSTFSKKIQHSPKSNLPSYSNLVAAPTVPNSNTYGNYPELINAQKYASFTTDNSQLSSPNVPPRTRLSTPHKSADLELQTDARRNRKSSTSRDDVDSSETNSINGDVK